MNNEALAVINRYRAEGFSDSTILRRIIDGGVDESDAIILSVELSEVTRILRR